MQGVIRRLEHVTLRAWPALETQHYDGWLLRFSQGYSGRSNSVNPLDASTLALDEKIAHCERLYAEHQLDIRFRLHDAAQPPELDAVLAERGYAYYSETDVYVCDLTQFPPATDSRFHFTNTLTDTWLRAYTTMNGTAPSLIDTLQAMLERVLPDSCFGFVEDTAVGLAVREGDYLGLFDIVVDATQRRQGLGLALVSSLMAWGRQQGAKFAYLQVVAENAPAKALYEKLGFRFHHKYWYRIVRL